MLTVEEARQRWRGVVVPLVTLFTEDGSVDLDGTAAHIEWLISRGARQGNTILLVAGSGGDFPMLNLEERKAVIRAVSEANNGRLPMIAGVQSTDIRDTIALCQQCEETGVDAAQIAGPYYYDGRPDDVIAWMTKVSENTRIPFAVYNNWYTGYNMPENLVDALLNLPNSIGAACVIVSEIGRPVTDPQLVDIRLTSEARAVDPIHAVVEEIVRTELAGLSELRAEVLGERVRLY